MTDAVRSTDTQEARAAQERLKEARALITDKEQQRFFDALFAGALPDDVLLVRPARLVALASAIYGEIAKHRPGASDVVLLDDDETRETVLVGINDDRPFLFDSALQAALAGGARIRAAFHPVIIVNGAPVSVVTLICNTVAGEQRTRLAAALRDAFVQGAVAVRDWKAMLARMKQARDQLFKREDGATRGDGSEDVAFLDWLSDNHFTFLGARDYALVADGANGRLEPVNASGLGVLADEDQRVIYAASPAGTPVNERPGLSPDVRAFLDAPDPLIVTKSAGRSLVHRRAHMDYIGVKTVDAKGAFNGEHRFVGLFTSSAYSAQPRAIPLLRKKIERVMARAGFGATSHDGKALTHILDTFPRDEMFQVSDEELYQIAIGILRLGGLPRLKLFLRFDRFDRFVSAILLAPRDHITTRLRDDIHAMLAQALNGRASAFDVAVDDSPLVRLHFIIGRNPGPLPDVDVKALESRIAALIETWDDGFVRALCAAHGKNEGYARLERAAAHFSPGYRDNFPPQEGATDLALLEELAAGGGLKLRARVWRKDGDSAPALRLKMYVLGEVFPLSASLPVFESMGLKVISEDAYPVSFANNGARQDAVILDFTMERADGLPVKLDAIKVPLEDALHAVLRGDAESDAFNKLVITGLGWRDVVILRATAKFLRQAAFSFSLAYMQQALVRNPDMAALLVALFLARNNPRLEGDRAKAVADIDRQIETALKDVPSLDDDRIIRRFKNVIDAILRTSFWQRGADGNAKPYIAFKFDSARLDELPAPRPWREIFVYAPSMEGVHLRFGRIARGGLRWSDRREDFRTEILGLVKAQQVKNAVIVPVGAKGGFYPKHMPENPTREQAMETGIAAYRTLINAMLDITDNLDKNGNVVPPPDLLRPDGDDPYLVVAADKGTATFSDIANGIALERGFWLGDAFASGGSVGYDHKKMGITARGAWEAIKRHFREMGTDIQTQDFTVIGVGDMSGDVFGNGMLLSQHIRLVAAFDHRHIFLDPNADAATGFAERERMFALPRSSWDDYDRSKIGSGGGIFSRSLKEIPLSPQVQALIGNDAASLSPPALIHALLKAKADLLWFGGIGTYIKAASQSDLEVGDRANDAVRVNGEQIQAKVVGEGANLGATQLGRIEYARSGGRIDTDAIDNSAGVDTSDHEVNIKILLGGPVGRGELSEDKRNAFLATLTDDVAAHVLADNYNQTLALSVAQMNGARDIDAQARMIRDLETRDKLNRAVEYLPSDAALGALERDGKALTRPELAVLLAYAKLDLDIDILASKLPDDPAFAGLLEGYFPPKAIETFPNEAPRHRLKREIVSTVLTNAVVNLAGIAFVQRMREVSRQDGAGVARAFVLTDGAYGLSALKTRIDALDLKVDASVQTKLYGEIANQFRRITPWFLGHVGADSAIADTVMLYRAGVDVLRQNYALTDADTARIQDWTSSDVPQDLARDIVLLPGLAAAPDIALLAHQTKAAPEAVIAIYRVLGAQLGFDRLRGQAARLSPPDHWDRLALRQLLDNLANAQAALTGRLLAQKASVEDWIAQHTESLGRAQSFLNSVDHSGDLSVAKLMLASSQIQNLA